MMKIDESLGLYIHIPFCVKKCNYCDFLSFAADERTRLQYVQSLVREMKLWKKKVSAYHVDTIFIGGGTPSLLEPGEMALLLDAIYENFDVDSDVEFTVECNPGTVSMEKLALMRTGGVNRISFGMQSAMNDELKCLGRIHTYEQFEESFALARQCGFSNINVDIMSAIPKQTVASYEETLKKVCALNPEHISSYSLIIEEGTPFFEQYASVPPVDEDTDRLMYERTKKILAEHGYERYEISNYAKKGRECQHNLRYWRRKPYLGIGLGAASFLENKRFSNERELFSYAGKTGNAEIPIAEQEELNREDEKAEFMYLGLRCMQGVSKQEFETCFHEKLDACYGEKLMRLEQSGLIHTEDDWVSLTDYGIDISNRVFEEFI